MASRFEPGARVCSIIRGYYYGIPGTIRRTSFDQIVELDNGLTIRIDDEDLRPVTDEDEARFQEQERERLEHDRRMQEIRERKADARLEAQELATKIKERDRLQRIEEKNERLQQELDAEQEERAREIARTSLKGSRR